jgi:Domain of unknown function (DUF6305)
MNLLRRTIMMPRLLRSGRLLAVMLAVAASGYGSAAQTERKFQQPILVTSSGQALDGFTVKTLLGRVGVNAAYDPKVSAAALGDAKTVIIAVGASNKGFGQAGITAETEVARTKAILEAAKAKGIAVICVHIGGAERRKGLSVQFVELVAPAADYLVVSQDGNADGYFSELSKRTGMPLTVIERSLDVGRTLASLIAQG